ncbi:DUF1109 domain-containing protein [Sphingomonas sp. R647]|uniref:NrsF family protein n=1 Tax=Sphingomonas sp. R647 TaxID=2875233 RepID=UPI001CD31758|nr:DUF1109 domain-containing protein [Sphingomonas sp. R647]MCA1197005.1 DUF1109 domain-containing protein [Sphingomonas sp. R647]
MDRPTSPLIAQLAEALEPVRPIRMAHGLALIALATAVTIAVVALVQGLWSGPAQGQAAAIFFIANGLIGLVGLASARAVVRMAVPRVGARRDGARWLLAALALLPVTALLFMAIEGNLAGHEHAADGLHCFLFGTASGLLVAVALLIWLRRGAPVAPNVAGLYTGIAAGALGSFAWGLSCPVDTIAHLGIWHVAPVAVSATMGRFIVPRCIRW